MKQEGRGASVWQVVSGFMECLHTRAGQSGVQYNGHVFHLTLATWERLTFNFGFYLLLITACDCRARTSDFAVRHTLVDLKWWKCRKAKCWSLIGLDTPSMICFIDPTSNHYSTHFCVVCLLEWLVSQFEPPCNQSWAASHLGTVKRAHWRLLFAVCSLDEGGIPYHPAAVMLLQG